MEKNIGIPDRILRFVIGLVSFGFIYVTANKYGIIAFGILGVFAIFQAIVGWCALYALLGKNTYSTDKKDCI